MFCARESLRAHLLAALHPELNSVVTRSIEKHLQGDEVSTVFA